MLSTGRAETVVYDTTAENDLVWGLGLGCQGVVTILVEPLPVPTPAWVGTLRTNLEQRQATRLRVDYGGDNPSGTQVAIGPPSEELGEGIFLEIIAAPPALVVFGAGDDAQPLVRFGSALGWHLTVADTRAAYATAERFSGSQLRRVAPASELADLLALDERTFAVVMTHRYRDDLPLLRSLLPRPLAYLGVLGPRQRTERLLAELKQEGFLPDAAMLAKLHAPVGLDLGGRTPESVALAIVAEIQARLTGRTPDFLRARYGPIHG